MSRDRVVYYSDEARDDFAGTHIHTRRVGADFPYQHTSVLWNAAAFLLYYAVAVPIVFLISKLYLGLRFENRKGLIPWTQGDLPFPKTDGTVLAQYHSAQRRSNVFQDFSDSRRDRSAGILYRVPHRVLFPQ